MSRLTYLIGHPEEFELESRIFHLVSLILFVASIAGFFVNFAIGMPFIALLITAYMFIGSFTYYYLSRFLHRTVTAKYLFLVSGYLVLTPIWFFNNGSGGSIPLIFSLLVILQVIFIQKFQAFWISMNIIVFSGLILVEYLFPESIMFSYNSAWDKALDYIFTYALFAFVVYLIIFVVFQNYRKDRENLNQTNQNLIRMVETTNKLNSIVSHDLKSNVGGIKNISSLLLQKKGQFDEDKVFTYIQLINNSSLTLTNLLDNLLQWTKMMTDNIRVNPVPCEVLYVIEQNIELFELLVNQKELKITKDVESDIVVYADEDMFKTVVRNVLSNAIKFSDNNSEIIITARKSDKNHLVDITIKDHGMGMTEDMKNDLLNKKIINSTPGTLQEKGTGLGFLICREFIEANNGILDIVSQPGEGSEIIVSLPADNESI